ncbi:hypothetical protein MLD38_015000 [Melastoma candidum]|uniref:Uncharacterized protein n=1 Tax=Melastoma candidum TaxID=119954 RepID=A0ACB9RHQ5_9MYRT|nr:hypothetical protein MLD38_015000 [Melastoma candidum]
MERVEAVLLPTAHPRASAPGSPEDSQPQSPRSPAQRALFQRLFALHRDVVLCERRFHLTQEDFEMAVVKVMKKETEKNMSLHKLWK